MGILPRCNLSFMAKDLLKSKKQRNAVLFIGTLILLLSAIALSVNNQVLHKQSSRRSPSPSFSIESNADKSMTKTNTEIMAEATRKKDITICNQISGGIAEQKSESRTLPDGAVADSFGHPAMTESEAKIQCRKQVAE